MKANNKLKSEEEIKAEILFVHDHFWEALGNRDIETRFSFCADNVTFIGTGLNEKAANKKEYIIINKRGIEQYPHKFEIVFLWKRISFIDEVAWVESEVEWEISLDGTKEKETIRASVVLLKTDNNWKIVHVHGSVPDYRYIGQNYMSNSESQRKNRELEMEVYKRTKELNQALEHLKSTQSQLIQSEKMASLGELTAGIAHEIQNPLNFVNNFSEVNKELIGEMKDELAVGNWQLAKEISADIEQNLDKINHHGKRADAIVKGMLQHSRISNGVKEPTDINALADEYLRLAYHGLRAKDKDFNATLKTDFDETIGKIDIIPQDIGRVILNLINNAFYAVDEKKKLPPPAPKGGIESPQDHFEPTVTVTTEAVTPPPGGPRGVKISVKDNGNGIPQKVLDKIFQPFFTTKPTGQGTGLGLSLAYDIVKAHGGELKVSSVENEGTTFHLSLPV
ncbi:MAG: nuclear transport factor 2 family protein [Bacteroidales bacterium]|nr:nuclear transport factor 2 family protein [Bacteroidales bacterium]